MWYVRKKHLFTSPDTENFISPEYQEIINLCRDHPHSKILSDKFLKTIAKIADGTLEAKNFPQSSKILDTLFAKVRILIFMLIIAMAEENLVVG